MAAFDSSHILREIHKSDFTTKDIDIFRQKNPNVKFSEIAYPKTGDTILHICARLSRTDLLNHILETWSKNVDIKNNDGKTALHEACQFAHYESVKILLENGAEFNEIKRADWTPLMFACTKSGLNAYEIIKLLLQKGAMTDIRNKDGWTALHLAVREGDEKIVRLLLTIDSDIARIRTRNGRTTLHIAALHGHYHIAKLLLDYVDPMAFDNSGNTPLHEAILGDERIVELLVSNGCDINSANQIGFSCLHIAASQGRVNMVRYLVQSGHIVNFVSKMGLTPLHCAARNKNSEVMKLLIALGADCDATDLHDRTANYYFQQ